MEKTIQNFIAQNNITLSLVRVPSNPIIDDKGEMINYSATLEMNGRKLETPFSTGGGWVEPIEKIKFLPFTNTTFKDISDIKKMQVVYNVTKKQFEPMHGFGKGFPVFKFELLQRCFKIREPKVEDVLNSLSIDSSVLEMDGFEDFCSNFGYDEDSRKAEKIYNACLQSAFNLRKFLGNAKLTELRECEGL